MTFERFMDVSLYHPGLGYYARASRRTGRQGDFITSVDVGPIFGGLLARQFAEMHEIIGGAPFDFLEAAASDGRLTRDVADGLARGWPATYDALRLHLIEVSPPARGVHRDTLGPHTSKLASSSDAMPDRVRGVIFANELLDALPFHAVVMRPDGLREIVVDVEGDALVEREAPSPPELSDYFSRLGIALQPGWRAEVNLRAVAWIRDAARRLTHGFLVLIDYGHRATELYSASHRNGTRISYDRHVAQDAWLVRPGEVDITAHVDLTSIERAAGEEGLTTIGILDQTYFLMGLGLDAGVFDERPAGDSGDGATALQRRLALKTLMVPGGLGSTLKVLIFGRDVGVPRLAGCSAGTRLT